MVTIPLSFFWAFFYCFSAAQATPTGHLIADFKTIPKSAQLLPYGVAQVGEMEGVIGFQVHINSGATTVDIPSRKMEFYHTSGIPNFPVPAGVVLPFGLFPQAGWFADFPAMTVTLNRPVSQGCRTYSGTVPNNVLQLEVKAPAGAHIDGNEVSGLPQIPPVQKTFIFQEGPLFALETVPVNQVKINICDLQDSTDNTTSCSTQVEARVKELGSHTVLGPLLSSLGIGVLGGTGTGTALWATSGGTLVATAATRELIKLPLLPLTAFLPTAGAVGLGVGAATFVTYEAVVLTKLFKARNLLKQIENAHKGQVKESWADDLERALKKNGITVRSWASETKRQILGRALVRLDLEGKLCNGDLKSKRIRKKLSSGKGNGEKLRYLIPRRDEIIKYLSENPKYLY